MKWLVAIIACASFLSGAAKPKEPTLVDLKQHYEPLTRLATDIEQLKRSPLLFKPLKSDVQLTYDQDGIRWHVLRPVDTLIVFDQTGMHTGDKGQTPFTLPQGKVQAFARMLTALMTADLNVLEKDFDVGFANYTLHATPKSGSELAFINQIDLHFQKNLIPSKLTLKMGEEETELTFKTFDSNLPKYVQKP